ncbi:putative glycolipid-binding domain-containing protein [Nocardiopsis coralliicola]
MSFRPFPRTAAWRHHGARDGFEVACFSAASPSGGSGGSRITGCTTAVEEGRPWVADYDIALNAEGATRSARVSVRSAEAAGSVLLESDGAGAWRVDGSPAPELGGCRDVDLEASVVTNALPLRRLALGAGERADAPAAFVRVGGLAVERLEQGYARVPCGGSEQHFDYAAPAFDVACRLVYDASGLVLDYPGLASRAA